MLRSNRRGFTLIELLTVIAIIAILAGMIFVGFGRVREQARLRSLDNTFHQVQLAVASYYTQNNSYPVPIGGVLNKQGYAEILAGNLDPSSDYTGFWGTFQTRPYTAAVGIADDAGLLDPFSFRGYRTDLKANGLSLMEYLPKGLKANALGAPTYPRDLPPLGAEGLAEFARLENIHNATPPDPDAADPLRAQRPLVYIAVNKSQAKIAARYWINQATPDAYATTWNWADPALQGITFPPASYDAFVLISQGPAGDTSGILTDPSPAFLAAAVPSPNIASPNATTNLAETYYFTQLRAFFLATRDWDDDGLPDLTYQGRNSRDSEYTINGQSGKWNTLPPGALNPNGYGPYVFVYGYD